MEPSYDFCSFVYFYLVWLSDWVHVPFIHLYAYTFMKQFVLFFTDCLTFQASVVFFIILKTKKHYRSVKCGQQNVDPKMIFFTLIRLQNVIFNGEKDMCYFQAKLKPHFRQPFFPSLQLYIGLIILYCFFFVKKNEFILSWMSSMFVKSAHS